ncbi:MAG: class I SAM-dependent methyltransferase [bacterium]
MNPNNRRLMRDHWESEASFYTEGRRISAADTRAFKLLELEGVNQLLEIGFGSGVVAAKILDIYPNLTYSGVDFASKFIRTARAKLTNRAHLVQGDAYSLPFRSAAFQRVLEMDAIHHFPREELPAVIREVVRVIKPGGLFLSVEDWALPPVSEREVLLYNLQKKRVLTRTGREYHPFEDEWMTCFKTAGLSILTVEHAARPFSFDKLVELEDREAMKDVARLKQLWGEEPVTTTMSLFLCRKN